MIRSLLSRRQFPLTPGALLLACCISSCLVVVAQRPEVMVQTGHSEAVRSISFSRDGKLLASGSSDGTVKLWDTDSKIELRTFTGHTKEVAAVAFSPGGNTIASGSWDGTLKLWDVASGRELYTIKGGPNFVQGVAFSPDGKTLAASFGSAVALIEATSGVVSREWSVHDTTVQCLAFSPDGLLLATGAGGSLRSGGPSDVNTVQLWKVADGTLVKTLAGHTDAIGSLAFAPDSRVLATSSRDKTVRVWDIVSGTQLSTFNGNKSSIDSLAISSDYRLLVGADFYGITIWDAKTGAVLRNIKGHTKAVTCVVFKPGSTTLASASYDKTIKLWDTTSGTELSVLKGTVDPVKTMSFSKNGKLFAFGQWNFAKLWDLKGGVGSFDLGGPNSEISSLAFSPDSAALVTAGDRLRLWDITRGIESKTLSAEKQYFKSVSFSPDGKRVAAIDVDGLNVWDLNDGSQHKMPVTTLASADSVRFSPDSQTLAIGDEDGLITICDAATLKVSKIVTGSLGPIVSLAFSPDGKTIASGTFRSTFFSAVYLFDVASGKEKLRFNKHSATINSLAFSPDGTLIASADNDGATRIWEPITGRELFVLKSGTVPVLTVTFSPNGKILATGGRDAQVRLWDVISGQELASLMVLGNQDWIVFTPDGLFDGSPAAWSAIRWRFNNDTFNFVPVEAFFSDFYFPGLLQDLFEGKRPKAIANIAQKDRRQPKLQLSLNPAQGGANLRNVAIRIDISSAPAGAQDVRLFRNGSLVKVWDGDQLLGKDQATLLATIPMVAGENHLRAYAFNRDNIKSSDVQLVVQGPETLRREATAYILAIGVNNYSNPAYNLKYAVADSEGFAAEVKRQLESLKTYSRVDVITLSNQQATKANITEQLRQLGARVQPEDTVVVYFSGHGTAYENKFYLIPNDLGYDGPRDKLSLTGLKTVLSHSISDRELETAFEKIDARQFLLVIDACNSGQALEAEEKRRGPMNNKGLAQLAYEKGIFVLTAAQSYQAALEAAVLGHGYLTYALVIEGLGKGDADYEPKDGSVLLREWLDYAANRVPQMQLTKLKDARGLGLAFSFVEGEKKELATEDRELQRPRVYYRREPDMQPMIVAKFGEPH